MNEDGTLVRVTMTVDYYFPKGFEVYIDEWLGGYPLSRHHASREAHEVGGSKTFVSKEIVKNPS